MVIALEMRLISPPVGVQVFMVKGIAPWVPLGTSFRLILPFWCAMLMVLLVPGIAPLRPNTMFGQGAGTGNVRTGPKGTAAARAG